VQPDEDAVLTGFAVHERDVLGAVDDVPVADRGELAELGG
jgi:hypothetical protein